MFQSAGGALQSGSTKQSGMRWEYVLVWFCRIVALLWIFKALAAWAIILGVFRDWGEFLNQTAEFQTIVIYFAVIDAIAAVGLWMTSSWGGVVWLIAVFSQLAAATMLRDVPFADYIILSALGVLVLLFLVLSWLAGLEEPL